MCGLLSLNLAGEWKTYMHVQLGVGAIRHGVKIRECNGKLNQVNQEAPESGI